MNQLNTKYYFTPDGLFGLRQVIKVWTSKTNTSLFQTQSKLIGVWLLTHADAGPNSSFSITLTYGELVTVGPLTGASHSFIPQSNQFSLAGWISWNQPSEEDFEGQCLLPLADVGEISQKLIILSFNWSVCLLGFLHERTMVRVCSIHANYTNLYNFSIRWTLHSTGHDGMVNFVRYF